MTPNSDWGGPGSIGCDVLMGALHIIPKRQLIKDLHESYSKDAAINIEELDEVTVDYAALAQSLSSSDSDEEVQEPSMTVTESEQAIEDQDASNFVGDDEVEVLDDSPEIQEYEDATPDPEE